MATITTCRARRLRSRVHRIGFCSRRPGLLHDWDAVEYPDPTSFGGVITVTECQKCWGWHHG